MIPPLHNRPRNLRFFARYNPSFRQNFSSSNHLYTLFSYDMRMPDEKLKKLSYEHKPYFVHAATEITNLGSILE